MGDAKEEEEEEGTLTHRRHKVGATGTVNLQGPTTQHGDIHVHHNHYHVPGQSGGARDDVFNAQEPPLRFITGDTEDRLQRWQESVDTGDTDSVKTGQSLKGDDHAALEEAIFYYGEKMLWDYPNLPAPTSAWQRKAERNPSCHGTAPQFEDECRAITSEEECGKTWKLGQGNSSWTAARQFVGDSGNPEPDMTLQSIISTPGAVLNSNGTTLTWAPDNRCAWVGPPSYDGRGRWQVDSYRG